MKPESAARTRIFLGVVVLIGIIASLTLYKFVADLELSSIRDEFYSVASTRSQSLYRGVRYNVEILYSARAFFESGIRIDEARFHDFTSGMLRRHRTLTALEFTLSDSATIRGGRASFPIRFIEPPIYRPMIGRNVGNDPDRETAIIEALRLDTPIATGPMQPLEIDGTDSGWVIVLPVHGEFETGLIQGVFRSSSFVEAVLQQYAPQHMTLWFSSARPGERLQLLAVHSTGPNHGLGSPSQAEFLWTGSFDVGGRHWQMECGAEPGYISKRRGRAPILLLIVSIALTLLFSIYFARVLERDRLIREQNARHVEELARRDERLREELSLARTIQQAMLPREIPKVEGIDVGLLFVPSGEVGGDYFDFLVPSEKSRLGVVLADISGHGVPAALLFSLFRVLAVNTLRAPEPMPDNFRRLNLELTKTFPRGRFASTFYAMVDAGNMTLRYVKASQEPGILLRRGEPAQLLTDGDELLGAFNPEVFGDPAYREITLPIQSGDTLFLFTDGLVEAESPEGRILGVEGLLDWLKAEQNAGPIAPQQLADRIRERVFQYAGASELRDDLTAMVIQVSVGSKESKG